LKQKTNQIKNIIFTVPTLNGGGAERIIVNYIRSLDINKFKISLILNLKMGEFLDYIPKYVNIVELNTKKTRQSFFKMYSVLKDMDIDLLVSTTNRMNILVLILSIFIKRKFKICLYEPSLPSAQFGQKYLPKYYLILMKLLYNHSDYIIAQTKLMGKELTDYYRVAKEKIIVTSNPIDTKFIQDNIKNINNPFNQNKINIIASGRIREEKGYEFLLRSFSKVIKKNVQFRLTILGTIGDTDYMKKLKGLIDDLNIIKYIEFVGFKKNPFPYYKYADLLVLSSKWEGLPNVVLEALYLQTPVVVTNCVDYFYEIIDEGVNGFIVDYGNEDNLCDRILRYDKLEVESNRLELPDYNKIFYAMK